ncbi:amino acid ABC transporter permease [Devosia sp. A369]
MTAGLRLSSNGLGVSIVFRELGLGDARLLFVATNWTILLSLFAFVTGTVVGLLVATLRLSRNRALRLLAAGYINIFQGTPFLVQLFVLYFGLTFVNIRLDAWACAAIGLTAYSSAYLAEIWRGCIQGIPAAQWEASKIVGLSKLQQQIYVILPQALLISLPATVGFFVQIIKATALLSVLGFAEILRTAQMINSATFQPFLIYGVCGLLYFILCWPLSRLSAYLEAKYYVY